MDWRNGILEAAKVYVRHNIPESLVFRRLGEVLEIRALQIDGLDWQFLDHMMSTTQLVPVRVHFEALAAAAGLPFKGVGPLLERLVELGELPASSLSQTELVLPERTSSDFGRLLRQLDLCTREQLARAVEIRREVDRKLGIEPALGSVLRSVAGLSVVDYVQALAIFRGVPFEGLDATCAQVYDASAGRHTGTTRTV